MIDGVIFDLDGTLVNTEPLHCKSYHNALKKYGIDLSEWEYCNYWIRDGNGIDGFVLEKGLDLDVGKVRDEKRGIFHELLRAEIQKFDKVDNVLEELCARDYPLALVTSSYRYDAGLVLELTDLGKYFCTVVTRNDVWKPKPNPEGFYLAKERLGYTELSPEHFLVVEDSEKGVIAAHRAGMRCVAVPNDFTKNNDFSLAEKVVGSIGEVMELLE
jgi:beta-phosphoglucomutase